MSLTPGTKLGSYVLAAPLGAGGMGEVYRAHDTTLARDVAIKALPDSVAHDPERVARFEREAKLLAALNHPHIAGIYGVERSGDARFLVLELVHGESLATRLSAGALPLPDALKIARQIAEALEAAHEKGIIHRDLKPANIMLAADDQVKVLDFGLAKALETETPGASLDQSPTMTLGAATQMGMILGTAAYMAPEQAKGRPADKRCDLWAFGCVLYEMLTGKRAFEGEDLSETLAAVIKEDVDWARLPTDMPPALQRLLRRCLVKDRKARLPDAAMARIEIDEALSGPASIDTRTVPTSPASMSRARLVALAGGAAVIFSVITGTAVWRFARVRDVPAPALSRFVVALPPGVSLVGNAAQRFAIARDGRHIVFSGAGRSGSRQLYVRSLDQLESVPIRGTETFPGSLFLSPDGEWVGYNDTGTGTLKKVQVTGGSPTTITEARAATGGFGGATWGEDGSIVFATAASPGLMKVPATGGVPEPLTSPTGERHTQPRFLPGGRGLLFTILRPGAPTHVAAVSVATGKISEFVEGSSPHYAPSGHLLFVREGVVWAAPFDANGLEVTGTAAPVLEGLGISSQSAPTGLFDLSGSGVLVYSPTEATAERTLVWVDRQGREEPIPGVPPRAYVYPRLSPDGHRIALDVRDQDQDVLTWDLGRSVLTRITLDRDIDQNPVWTPDGSRIAFLSGRTSPAGIFWQSADGTGAPERLFENQTPQMPMAFTRDGAHLILREAAPSKTAFDLMVLTVGGTRRIDPLIQTEAVETNAELSWDGRWLAYESSSVIWVTSFPDVSKGRWQVSSGTQPLWSRDGRELFFLGRDGRLMRVAVQTSPTFTASAPTRVLERSYVWNIVGLSARTYDISPDGKRFLMIKDVESAAGSEAPQLVAVLNWFEELKRRVPPAK